MARDPLFGLHGYLCNVLFGVSRSLRGLGSGASGGSGGSGGSAGSAAIPAEVGADGEPSQDGAAHAKAVASSVFSVRATWAAIW